MVRSSSTGLRLGLSADSNRQNDSVSPPPQSPDSIHADLLASMGGGDLATQVSTPRAITTTASEPQGNGLEGGSCRATQPTRLLDPSESGLSSNSEYEEDELDVWSPEGSYEGQESDEGDDFDDGEGFEDDEQTNDDQGSGDIHREGERRGTLQHDIPNRRPHAPPQSKLGLRIQEQRRRGIEVDSNGVRKGKIRCTNLGLHYLLDGQLVPAVFHADIRSKLLQMTDRLGSYDEEPVKGADELDRTAFKQGQEHWVLDDRYGRPQVLTYWEKPDSTPDHRPKLWYDCRRLVLDTDCRPLKLYDELPLTISGQCEGSRSEQESYLPSPIDPCFTPSRIAMLTQSLTGLVGSDADNETRLVEAWRRLNSNITMNDIKTRMGWTTSKGIGLVQKPIKTPALANRMSSDRCRMGLKAWTPKEGSSIKGTAASFAKAGHRLLDPQTREKIQRKKQKAKAKKMIDLSSVTIHEAVQEALSKPGKKPARRVQRETLRATATPGHPTTSGKQNRDEEEHGMDELLAAQYGRGSREQPYSLESEASFKRPRLSPTQTFVEGVESSSYRPHGMPDS
ncbi:MAG: hypothetical protein Q9213_008036 [Squamulea squamosa]